MPPTSRQRAAGGTEVPSQAPHRPVGPAQRVWRRVVQRALRPAPLAHDRLGRPVTRELQVATARFLTTTAYGDADSIGAERRTIRRGIQALFGLTRRDAQCILADADREAYASDEPAARVRQDFDLDQRMRIMGLAWDLAHTDGLVPIFERVLADQVGALAGLHPHQAEQARSFSTSRWI